MAKIEAFNGSANVPSGLSDEPTPLTAKPDGPAAKAASNEVVGYQACADNHYSIDNANADPKAAGSAADQLKQAAAMGAWTGLALDNAVGINRDRTAGALLKHLAATPPDFDAKSECVNYTSTIKGVSAQAAFDYFTHNPKDVFGASGITLHPPTARLEDGARVFLAEPGVTPPVFAPIEVHIDEAAKTVRITTLDGHPLRGVNQFSFEDSGKGDCQMHQSSLFQLSSFAAEGGSAAMSKAQKAGVPLTQDPIERQHQIWERAHADVADHARHR